MLLGVASLAGSAWWMLRLQDELVAAELHRPSVPAPVSAAPSTAGPDFTASLGRSMPESRILAIVDSSVKLAGVELLSTAVIEHAATPVELGRQEITLGMRGPYGATKHVLAELHDRVPGAAIKRLRMQSDAALVGQVNTSLVLSVWSAALASDQGLPQRPAPR